MGLFRRQDHSFRKSALSSSVPLDGSDTVVGLRQLDRNRRSQDLHTFLESNLTGLQEFGRQGYQRYKGPYLDQLKKDDLKSAPVLWILALCGGSRKQWHYAYNVPESAAHLQERLEENLMRYKGNYVWMAAAAAFFATILRPWALLGLLCMGAIYYINDRYPSSGGDLFTPAASATNGQAAHGQQQDLLRAAANAALYILIFYSRCMAMLPRCALAALTLVLLHASLRRARSEYGALNWRDLDTQAAKQQIDICQLEADRLRQSMRPGCLFSEVIDPKGSGLGGLARRRAGIRNGERAKDPRRVFRELWGYGKQVGSFAVGCAIRFVQLYWNEGRERLRTWRVPLHV